MDEITLREEYAKMNKLTGKVTLSSGVQARYSDKSRVKSLEGTVNDPVRQMLPLLAVIEYFARVDTRNKTGARGSYWHGRGGGSWYEAWDWCRANLLLHLESHCPKEEIFTT